MGREGIGSGQNRQGGDQFRPEQALAGDWFRPEQALAGDWFRPEQAGDQFRRGSVQGLAGTHNYSLQSVYKTFSVLSGN